MNKLITFLFLFFFINQINAQLAEVQANYNSVGDVDFVAYNNTSAPLFINIDFADLENTTFDEPLPYLKLIEPGFNSLFTLRRYLDADVPRFNYQIKVFRSNPVSFADLEFPYLIPLAPGKTITVFDVQNIDGFWGSAEPDSWNATGFNVKPKDMVYASRNGFIVEIVGNTRNDEPATWYHTWNNAVTILQPDGTLMCYKNVIVTDKKMKVAEKIYAGQIIGEVAPGQSEIIQLIFQHSLNSEKLRFVFPQYVASENKVEPLVSSKSYSVVHPEEIIGKEMTKKEKRKYLK